MIDAPEKCEAFSERARQALLDLCFGKPAQADAVDRYGRHLAEVTCNGVHANGSMMQNGFAWVYRAYAGNRRGLYVAEGDARLSRRDLRADDPPRPRWV